MPQIRKSVRRWLRKRFLSWAGPFLAAWTIRLLSFTLRYEVKDHAGLIEEDSGSPFIFAFWHNRILLLPAVYEKLLSHRRLVVMISRSRDGAMISATAARFGIESARGSSSGKGAAALIKLSRHLIQDRKDVAVTPDGPRGPKYSVQKGILHLARTSGYSVIPVTYHLESKWEVNSWDAFQIPKPFTRCTVTFGKQIKETTDDDMVEQLKMSLGG